MRHSLAAFPYKLHTILTDNGVAFTDCASTKYDWKVHPFNRICLAHGIKHKLTQPYHPWINGQAERMNRTLKEATVKSFHYETLAALTDHLQTFVVAYNFAKHLQDATLENSLSDHLRGVDKRPVHVYDQPAPPHPGTIHLDCMTDLV